MLHDDPHHEHELAAKVRTLDVRAPDALRHAVERRVATARPRPRAPRRAFAFGAFAAVAAALAVFLVLGGGDGATVRDAAPVALRAPAGGAPPTVAGGALLAAHVDAISFPTWTNVGWRPVGQRSDTVGGHALRTVFYDDAQGRRLGYAIADGALPVDGGRLVHRRGAALRLLRIDGATVVTWRRDGHTCILAARDVAPGRLLTLASYAA